MISNGTSPPASTILSMLTNNVCINTVSTSESGIAAVYLLKVRERDVERISKVEGSGGRASRELLHVLNKSCPICIERMGMGCAYPDVDSANPVELSMDAAFASWVDSVGRSVWLGDMPVGMIGRTRGTAAKVRV